MSRSAQREGTPMSDATFHPDLFAGKVALVVGGTTGIGAAIADAFAGLGAVVTVTGATHAECAAARAAPAFRCRDAVALDVRDAKAAAQLVDDLPRLDVLVNCAGVIRRGHEHVTAVFEDVLAINLTGTMRCCTLARPKLKASGGAIVNTASVLSFFGGALVPGYAASKGGVAQLTKSLAIAYAADGIRVNAIAPGSISFPGGSWWKRQQADPEGIAAFVQREIPFGRFGTPEEIGNVVAFLASPKASWVAGASIVVDGCQSRSLF